MAFSLLGLVYASKYSEPFQDQKMNKQYYVKPLLDAPKIDGILNDPIWQLLTPITDFIQEDPHNMEMPTEKTEVYITYNERAIYIAARLYDSEPSQIVRRLAPRDDWYGAFDEMADWFSISFDSYHDHQTAFSFSVNASGVISDEMIFHDSEYDSDWNAVWNAEVNIDTEGWSLEIEIPFSNIPFYEIEETIWGLNISRFIQRKYETINWVTFPMDVEGIVSKYGHLYGLKGIYPPAKFEFTPYTMIGTSNYNDIRLKQMWEPWDHRLNYYQESNKNLGLDFIYRINPSSRLMFTINPDFGQIESDPANINLTAFETYYKEKRPFFLKNMDIFQTPIELFYSRRIGDNSSGIGMAVERKDTLYYDITIPTKINLAAKLTGKDKNGLSYGILSAFVTESDSSHWKNFYDPDTIYYPYNYPKQYLIGRVKQDFFQGNSFLGLMSTSSIVDSAHAISIDGMVNLFDNKLSIDGQLIMDQNSKNGIFGSISFYPSGIFSGWFDYYYFSKGLDINDLGYLWRDNFKQTKFGLRIETLEYWYFVRNFSCTIGAGIEENLEGLNLGKSIDISYDIEFNNFWSLAGTFYKINDYFDDRKIIHDFERNEFGPPVFIPEIQGYTMNISSDKHHSLTTSFSMTWANNKLDDSERAQFAEINYKPNSFINFATSYDHYMLQKTSHWLESFWEDKDSMYHHIFSSINREIEILTLRSTININRNLSLQTYIEMYSNNDIYSNYKEFFPTSKTYEVSQYILGEGNDWAGMPLYTTDTSSASLKNSYVDPNYDLQFHPKYTDFRSILVLKWNYQKGSSLYLVYSNNKAVDGYQFNKSSKLSDFITFNKFKPWTEVIRDQSFLVKITYWFEK